MRKQLLSALTFVMAINIASAQDTTKAVTESKKLNINGYVDAYYSYNLNNPDNADNFGTTAVGRIFDGYHNQVALGLAQVKLDYTTNKSEIVVDLAYGPNGMLGNFGNTGTSSIIKQAYVSTALTDKLNFTIGQYGTHIGYELIDAPDNFHYSLSYLFGNGPFYHTGAKLDYAVSDKVAFMAGVVNGWDAIFDNNKAKSITAQIGLTPNDDFFAYLNWIGGNEAPSAMTGDSTSAFKHMIDLTTGLTVSEKFSVGINAAYGFNEYDGATSNWGGGALYLQYNVAERFGIGLRGEYFDDTKGTQYLGTSYTGITLTGSYTSESGAVTIKPEFRYDGANDNIYYSGADNSLVGSQSTIGIAVIGKF